MLVIWRVERGQLVNNRTKCLPASCGVLGGGTTCLQMVTSSNPIDVQHNCPKGQSGYKG